MRPKKSKIESVQPHTRENSKVIIIPNGHIYPGPTGWAYLKTRWFGTNLPFVFTGLLYGGIVDRDS